MPNVHSQQQQVCIKSEAIMSTLITGVEGFLGKRLAQLLNSRNFKVTGVDVAPASGKRAWPVIAGDVTDRNFIERLFVENDIVNIIHCGGISGPHVCNNNPTRVFEVNILGTLNLLESARKHKLKGRMLLASSSSVYGQASEKASITTPVVEGQALLASEPYGCSKVACESIARAYSRQEKLDILSLRVSIVYGPERITYCGITQMIKAAITGVPMVLAEGCDIPLPWVHIDDVCSAFLASLEAPRDRIHEIDTLAYNVNGPKYPTLREIAKIIQDLVPGASTIERDYPDPYAMNARKMSIAAIERDLGWKPVVSIAEGVRSLYKALVPGVPSAK